MEKFFQVTREEWGDGFNSEWLKNKKLMENRRQCKTPRVTASGVATAMLLSFKRNRYFNKKRQAANKKLNRQGVVRSPKPTVYSQIRTVAGTRCDHPERNIQNIKIELKSDNNNNCDDTNILSQGSLYPFCLRAPKYPKKHAKRPSRHVWSDIRKKNITSDQTILESNSTQQMPSDEHLPVRTISSSSDEISEEDILIKKQQKLNNELLEAFTKVTEASPPTKARQMFHPFYSKAGWYKNKTTNSLPINAETLLTRNGHPVPVEGIFETVCVILSGGRRSMIQSMKENMSRDATTESIQSRKLRQQQQQLNTWSAVNYLITDSSIKQTGKPVLTKSEQDITRKLLHRLYRWLLRARRSISLRESVYVRQREQNRKDTALPRIKAIYTIWRNNHRAIRHRRSTLLRPCWKAIFEYARQTQLRRLEAYVPVDERSRQRRHRINKTQLIQVGRAAYFAAWKDYAAEQLIVMKSLTSLVCPPGKRPLLQRMFLSRCLWAFSEACWKHRAVTKYYHQLQKRFWFRMRRQFVISTATKAYRLSLQRSGLRCWKIALSNSQSAKIDDITADKRFSLSKKYSCWVLWKTRFLNNVAMKSFKTILLLNPLNKTKLLSAIIFTTNDKRSPFVRCWLHWKAAYMRHQKYSSFMSLITNLCRKATLSIYFKLWKGDERDLETVLSSELIIVNPTEVGVLVDNDISICKLQKGSIPTSLQITERLFEKEFISVIPNCRYATLFKIIRTLRYVRNQIKTHLEFDTSNTNKELGEVLVDKNTLEEGLQEAIRLRRPPTTTFVKRILQRKNYKLETLREKSASNREKMNVVETARKYILRESPTVVYSTIMTRLCENLEIERNFRTRAATSLITSESLLQVSRMIQSQSLPYSIPYRPQPPRVLSISSITDNTIDSDSVSWYPVSTVEASCYQVQLQKPQLHRLITSEYTWKNYSEILSN